MKALELTAFGLFGIVLTLATTGMTDPKPYMTVAGGMGIPVEDALTAAAEPRFAYVRHAASTVEVPASQNEFHGF